jgi:hypothetical protein
MEESHNAIPDTLFRGSLSPVPSEAHGEDDSHCDASFTEEPRQNLDGELEEEELEDKEFEDKEFEDKETEDKEFEDKEFEDKETEEESKPRPKARGVKRKAGNQSDI